MEGYICSTWWCSVENILTVDMMVECVVLEIMERFSK